MGLLENSIRELHSAGNKHLGFILSSRVVERKGLVAAHQEIDDTVKGPIVCSKCSNLMFLGISGTVEIGKVESGRKRKRGKTGASISWKCNVCGYANLVGHGPSKSELCHSREKFLKSRNKHKKATKASGMSVAAAKALGVMAAFGDEVGVKETVGKTLLEKLADQQQKQRQPPPPSKKNSSAQQPASKKLSKKQKKQAKHASSSSSTLLSFMQTLNKR